LPQPATTVQFTNQLPLNLRFVGLSTDAGVNCTAPQPGSAGGLIRCNFLSLDSGQSALIGVTVSPAAGIGSINSTASVSMAGAAGPVDSSASVILNVPDVGGQANVLGSSASVSVGGNGGSTGLGGAATGGGSSATQGIAGNVSTRSNSVSGRTRPAGGVVPAGTMARGARVQ
jgi:hypothetical protein